MEIQKICALIYLLEEVALYETCLEHLGVGEELGKGHKRAKRDGKMTN